MAVDGVAMRSMAALDSVYREREQEMPATHMKTPVGPLPIRRGLIERFKTMTDREIADETFQGGFINPEAFAELCDRGLCFRGDREVDVYARIESNGVSGETSEDSDGSRQ